MTPSRACLVRQTPPPPFCPCVTPTGICVADENGFNFLYYLEQTVVGDKTAFEAFFKAYIQRFAYQSISSYDFKAFFIECVAE